MPITHRPIERKSIHNFSTVAKSTTKIYTIMTPQSTTSDSFISFFLDGLCASTASTAMKMSSQDDDDNSVSEVRTGDLQVSDLCSSSPQQHYMCERDDEESCTGREYNERSSSPTMSPVKSYDGTHVTATMTWASSFDLNDAMSAELQCIQEIFEPNDERFHSFSEGTTNSNSIFRSGADDYDHEQRRHHGTLVRMKHANYTHETLMSSPRCILKSKSLNDHPSSPTYLPYPDEKAKEEARRQFLVRHHIAEHPELHNLVMGRAA